MPRPLVAAGPLGTRSESARGPGAGWVGPPIAWEAGAASREWPIARGHEDGRHRGGWGDLTDAQYQAERDATRAALAELPDGDRIRAFDAYRARVLALPEAIAVASPARREELCRIVIERVVVRDRQLEAIEWQPQARPFFADMEERQREWPQGGSGTRPLSSDDVFAWYVA